MVRDTMWEASTEKEIARLEALMKDAKLPVYPDCPDKYTKIFSCLKLLQLKAAHHWTDQSFKAVARSATRHATEGESHIRNHIRDQANNFPFLIDSREDSCM